MSCNITVVVPAKAGTHNPWRQLPENVSAPLPKREHTAYGSRPSPGRRGEIIAIPDTPPHSRHTRRPSSTKFIRPKIKRAQAPLRREQGKPGARCTRSSACNKKAHAALPCAACIVRPRAGWSSVQRTRPANPSRDDAAASTASHPAFVTIMSDGTVAGDIDDLAKR